MNYQTEIIESPEKGAKLLNEGEIIAFPTETVYGVGASIEYISAVKNIYKVKQRPSDNPLIIHVAPNFDISSLVSNISTEARVLINEFMPGPLTIVLPKSSNISSDITCGLDTIAIRMPSDSVAQSILSQVNMPVAASSANQSGLPSATAWEHVHTDLNGLIPAIIKSRPSEFGLESTVLDCTQEGVVKLLRSGSISIEQIEQSLSGIKVTANNNTGVALCPGMKYKHYSPKAKVIPVERVSDIPFSNNSAFVGLSADFAQSCEHQYVYEDIQSYAKNLYSAFRECDELGITTIYCQVTKKEGLGYALFERILKAAN